MAVWSGMRNTWPRGCVAVCISQPVSVTESLPVSTVASIVFISGRRLRSASLAVLDSSGSADDSGQAAVRRLSRPDSSGTSDDPQTGRTDADRQL